MYLLHVHVPNTFACIHVHVPMYMCLIHVCVHVCIAISYFVFAVNCVRSRPDYFGQALYKSMKGIGTDDDTLVRIIVSRSEVNY